LKANKEKLKREKAIEHASGIHHLIVPSYDFFHSYSYYWLRHRFLWKVDAVSGSWLKDKKLKAVEGNN